MRPLGEFSHISSTGSILFRGKNYPPLYCEVATRRGQRVGKVVDVIGPVSYPYFVVRPEVKLSEKLISEIKSSGLFIIKDRRRTSVGRKKSR